MKILRKFGIPLIAVLFFVCASATEAKAQKKIPKGAAGVVVQMGKIIFKPKTAKAPGPEKSQKPKATPKRPKP